MAAHLSMAQLNRTCQQECTQPRVLPAVNAIVKGYQAATSCLPTGLTAIHVYKTGGSTLLKELYNLCPNNMTRCFASRYRCEGGVVSTRTTAFTNHEPPSVRAAHRRPTSLIVASVRDPTDRLVSAFLELKRRATWDWSKHARAKPGPGGDTEGRRYWAGDFESFLVSIEKRGFWNAHFAPQADLLLTPNGAHALPVDYLAWTSDISDVVSRVIPSRLGLDQTDARRIPIWRSSNRSSTSHDRLNWPTVSSAQQLRICVLYRIDYGAFAIPSPSPACQEDLVRSSCAC